MKIEFTREEALKIMKTKYKSIELTSAVKSLAMDLAIHNELKNSNVRKWRFSMFNVQN